MVTLVGVDAMANIWASIRTTRAERPGKAGPNGKRADVYVAALEQFEQLIQAARTVGYASRPLPLYYALSQAGRAIAAAHVMQPWELRGHGLKVCVQTSPLSTIVRPVPGPQDSFSRLCSASPGPLTEPVGVEALFASLPDLFGVDVPGESRRRPLSVHLEPMDGHIYPYLNPYMQATVAGLPNRVFEGLDQEASDLALMAELEHYPTAAGWQRYSPQGIHLERPDDYGWAVELQWDAGGQSPEDHESKLLKVAPEYRLSGRHWMRPTLNAAGDSLSVLMTWWALLYGLSVVARYHPREWANTLQVNKSRIAVPLERTLDIALEAVPHYVLEALTQEQILV